MAKRLDPAAGAASWKSGLAAAGPKMTAGVNGVTVAPTELAAQNVDRQVAGVQAAAASGKTAARLRRVSLQSWQQSMIQKGVPRLASGAAAGAAKYQEFASKFYPVMAAASEAARAMPKGGVEEALNRVRTVITAAKNFAATNQ